MLDEASRLQNKRARAANPAVPAVPSRLLHRNAHQPTGAAAASGVARQRTPPAETARARAQHSAGSGRLTTGLGSLEREPRDEREAKKMETERFHSLLLSLNMSLDDSRKGSSNTGAATKTTLKGRFTSNQDYADTYGPLVLEEIRAEFLQERIEQGQSFRPAILRELQHAHEAADFHYFTLALDMSQAEGVGSGGGAAARREFYDYGDVVLVQMKTLTWQEKRCPLCHGKFCVGKACPAKHVEKHLAGPEKMALPAALSPITRRALNIMSSAKGSDLAGTASLSTERGQARFKGGPRSVFEGESHDTPPGQSSKPEQRIPWGGAGDAQARVSNTNIKTSTPATAASGTAALGDATGQWVQDGTPLEFLAIVMHVRKRESLGIEQAGARKSVSGSNSSSIDLRLRASRSMRLEKWVPDEGRGVGDKKTALAGSGRVASVWKVMRLKNAGSAIREWRAVRAVRETASGVGFGRAIHSDLLKDLIRPSKGSLPTSEQVDSVMAALNPKVVEHIKGQCNPSQLCAVAAACASSAVDDGSSRAAGGFTLLQGPPGTGKTTVILQILNFLHLLQYQRYYDRRLSEMRSGGVPDARDATVASISADDHVDLTVDNCSNEDGRTSGLGLLGDVLKDIAAQAKSGAAYASSRIAKKPRILVCAPSNAAVDLLVERLMLQKLRDAQGFYTPDMIRVGSPSACSERIRVVTLDYQVDQILRTGAGALEELKSRFRMLLDRREKLRREARGFGRGDLPRGMDQALIDVGTKIENTQRDLARLQIVAKMKTEGGPGEEVKDQLRAKLLEDAQIVFTTLNSSGQEFFARMSVGFRTVIIDEACQAVEASTLIPLLLDVRRCILVGDPKQLPATVISTSDTAAQYQRSLFERLMQEGHVTHILDTQYRMHPAIRHFPSDYFYNAQLKDGPPILAMAGRAYQSDAWFGPFRFFDLQQSRETKGGVGGGMSLRNKGEATLVALLCKELFRKYSSNGELRRKVCVLTPYRQQRTEIINVLQREFGHHAIRSEIPDGRKPPPVGSVAACGSESSDSGRKSPDIGSSIRGADSGRQSQNLGVERGVADSGLIDVMTVDACQGQERDIVILSCVRANHRGAVGFVNDVRRMNVAITRAKHCLLVVGNAAALQVSEPWKAFITHAKQRRCVTVLDINTAPNFKCRPPVPPPHYFQDADARSCLLEQQRQQRTVDPRRLPCTGARSMPAPLLTHARSTSESEILEVERVQEREEGEVLSEDGLNLPPRTENGIGGSDLKPTKTSSQQDRANCLKRKRDASDPTDAGRLQLGTEQVCSGREVFGVAGPARRRETEGKNLECESCFSQFWFSNEERQRLLAKGVNSIPLRCRPCRMGRNACATGRGEGLQSKAFGGVRHVANAGCSRQSPDRHSGVATSKLPQVRTLKPHSILTL